MTGSTDKSNYFFKCHIWLIPVFFIVCSHRTIWVIIGLLLFSGNISSQCPGSKFVKEQVIAIYNSTSKKNATQLKELLALRQQLKIGDLEKDSSLMFLLQKIGILYSRQLNYPKAIDFTNESIRIAKECIPDHSCNTLALADNYYNLYYFYGQTEQLEKKYEAIDSCIFYAMKKESNRFDMAISPLNEKSEYLFNKGDYSLCSKYAKAGEEIIQKYYHGEDSIGYIVIFVTRQANALYFSKNIISAEKLLENKIEQFEQTGNRNQCGPLYTLLGLINRDKQNYSKALNCFQQGFQVDSIIEFRKGCAVNLGYIGALYAKNFNQFNTGLRYCGKALGYADASDSLLILGQTANIYVLKGMYDKAQHFFQQAFSTVQPGMNETTMLQNSFKFPGFNLLQYLSDLTTDKGNAYVQQYYQTKNEGHLRKALNIYKKGDLFLAKVKNEQQLQFNSNLIWRTTARNLYEHAIEACYANKNIEDAFYFFEKSRAILLNDQINEQRWMADEDIANQAKIKKMIIEQEGHLAALPASSKEYLTIQGQLNVSLHEQGKLIRNIKNKNPLFYQNFLDTVFMTVSQLRKSILNDSKTLVEMFSGDSSVYVLTITPNHHFFTRINKHLYDSLTNSFNLFITNRDRLNKYFPGFVKTSHYLYSLIFQHNMPPDGSIIISPDGVSYPFEALVIKERDQLPDYFLNHYATSYTYSVKYLTNQFAANTNTSNIVLGMAPVRYKNHDSLAELFGSDISLKTINNYFSGATNYVLEKATRNNFLQNFPRYNIIQLYTHAAKSGKNNDPVIYFADSALFLSELIPDRKPVTQLVVLSACETATGKLYEGEGIFSFNRGFAALGIPAAVSNLWSVDNKSTYQITEFFYKYLSKGLPTDIALQKAKLEFIHNSSSKEKRLPYFWAGSILTGKVDIIKSNAGFPWKEVTAAAILLLCTGYFTKKYFKKRKNRKAVDLSEQA